MHKKSIIVPILAVIIVISGVMASGGLFPDTPAFPRIPTTPGTIGHILYNFFEADGSAKNTQYLSGVSSTGYLQNNNCTDPINNKWTGVDNNGRGICGNGGAVLAGIAKFTEIAGAVEVLKYGSSTWAPANTTDLLYPGDYIRTDASGTGTIQFVQDDSIIRLFTDTTLELRIGDLDGNSVAEAILSDGRLWGRILSSTGVNLGGGGVVTGVRGTSVDVFKVGTLYTISVTDSVNPVNVLKKDDGTAITAVKDGSTTIPNLDFGKGTRFIYNDGDIYNIKKITDDKNNFYVDPWFRKNTRLDAKYMADLVEGYGNNVGFASKKSRLISELNTTIEPNNTGTLVRLLQDYPALAPNITEIVNILDEENKSGAETLDLRNMRKAKRFECKAKEKTYFPGLDGLVPHGCAGSWDTLSITDFIAANTGSLFGKNSNWNYVATGVYTASTIGKVTSIGDYISYTGSSYGNLSGKKIKITLIDPVGTYIPSPAGNKWYIFDGGNVQNRFFVYKNTNCGGNSDPGKNWICNADSVLGLGLYTGQLDITIELSLTTDPSKVVIGNGPTLNFPIAAKIKSISIY